MKKVFLVLSIFIVSLVLAQGDAKSDVSSFNKNNVNWYNKDLKQDKIAGASVDKLYNELLKDTKAKKAIIVAVIDGGVDVKHKDLEGRIWINTDEIADNGVDDDKNGYIDDVYGWNFMAMPMEQT